ncbi:Bactericidal permeability-increasing protein, alpha/beta domain [Pseudocohnilembus persalinus]|uniref:Bactericidal permeability-increasing protein, alpha/beta domain n=1 Tax=Pseudocohnilembus persalinus TaxID=266149 RepID=A0A0V0QFG9_PSEPJ|nr:Bactericidal permeability-increasing protein, alpha/beta domain [Pseudocohnilembus persalinus]|eukprot:KRX00939.1 Bactericidal permeability-increasing protein, alpha/beta domain [Pseudocohnilembus persalinus]
MSSNMRLITQTQKNSNLDKYYTPSQIDENKSELDYFNIQKLDFQTNDIEKNIPQKTQQKLQSGGAISDLSPFNNNINNQSNLKSNKNVVNNQSILSQSQQNIEISQKKIQESNISKQKLQNNENNEKSLASQEFNLQNNNDNNLQAKVLDQQDVLGNLTYEENIENQFTQSQQLVSDERQQTQQFFFDNQQSQFYDKNKLISKGQNYNPGIEVQVTNESLNDLSQKIGNLLQKKLLYMAIPDIDTVIEGIKVKINDGEIDFFVISENEFYFSQTQDGESIIKYNIQIQALQIEFNYMLQKNALLKFKDKGIINLQKFQLTAEVQPLNQNGKLIIEPTNINLYLGEVTVYLGNSSIKYLAAEILQTAIQQFLENIQEKVQETILEELKQIGNLFPQFVNFKYAQNQIIFNLELVYDPYIQNETLYLGFNGEFYKEGKKPSYINPNNQFKPINDSKATRIFADQDVFNTLFETLFSIKKQSFQLNFPAEALNGYLFNVNSVDIEKLLGNSVNEVEFRFYEQYFAFLIDF